MAGSRAKRVVLRTEISKGVERKPKERKAKKRNVAILSEEIKLKEKKYETINTKEVEEISEPEIDNIEINDITDSKDYIIHINSLDLKELRELGKINNIKNFWNKKKANLRKELIYLFKKENNLLEEQQDNTEGVFDEEE